MSRAVLVMDMPESCSKCMFLYEFSGIKNCNLMNVMYGGASRLSQTNFTKCRHEKCPLSPMPEWLKELKALRTWKNDVMEDFCKVDCSSIGEVYQCGIRRGYNKAIDDFTKWYEDHEHKRGFPYTIGNIKTCLSSEGIVREFKIAKQKAGDSY